jgi:ABC-type glycerol-3-phosphate transport system substrate-binding protein
VKNKKIFALFASALVAVSIVSPINSMAAGQITINYWSHVNPPANDLDKILIARFEKANPNIKVNFLPVAESDIPTKFTTAISGGGGPDLINLFSSLWPKYASTGLLASVDYKAYAEGQGQAPASVAAAKKYFEDIYSPKVVAGFQINGAQIGVPHEVSNYAFWTNSDMYKKAGLDPVAKFPKTWEDVIANCAPILKSNPGKSGLVLPLFSAGEEYLVFDQMVRSAGGLLFSADGKTPYLDSPAAVKALTLWRDLVKKYKCIIPSLGPTASTDNIDVFGGASSAMLAAAGAWYIPYLQGSFPKVYKSYTVGSLPVFAGSKPAGGAIYSYALLVPKQSKNAAAAWKLAGFLAANGQEFFNKTGVWLGDKATLSSAETAKSPHWAIFKDNLDTGVFLPPIIPIDAVTEKLKAAIEGAALGTADPKAALATAQKAVLKLLSK